MNALGEVLAGYLERLLPWVTGIGMLTTAFTLVLAVCVVLFFVHLWRSMRQEDW